MIGLKLSTELDGQPTTLEIERFRLSLRSPEDDVGAFFKVPVVEFTGRAKGNGVNLTMDFDEFQAAIASGSMTVLPH